MDKKKIAVIGSRYDFITFLDNEVKNQIICSYGNTAETNDTKYHCVKNTDDTRGLKFDDINIVCSYLMTNELWHDIQDRLKK